MALVATGAAYVLTSGALLLLDVPLPAKLGSFLGLSLPFAVGVAFWHWQDRVVLSIWGVGGLAVAAWALRDTAAYPGVLLLVVAYGTMWVAYVPAGWIRAYNRVGDYSYGIYIYAFPAQGLAMWLWGPTGPWENVALALPLTLVPSILSWHLIEKPSLAARGSLVAWLHPEVGHPAELRADRRV